MQVFLEALCLRSEHRANPMKKGVQKVSAVIAFCGAAVATVLLIVGECCFGCAKWIADRSMPSG